MSNYKMETKCVQSGYNPGNGEPRVLPIVQSTTFRYTSSDQMGRLFDLEESGYFYTRLQNPTNDAVAEKICELEGGVAAMLTSSGQAANYYAAFNICNAGDHIISAATIYGGTYNLFGVTLPKLGIEVTFVDQDASEEEIARAFRPNTKALFGETISNPGVAVLDIEKFARIAHGHGVPLIVDNTFATPINCRPIEWGADIDDQIYGRPCDQRWRRDRRQRQFRLGSPCGQIPRTDPSRRFVSRTDLYEKFRQVGLYHQGDRAVDARPGLDPVASKRFFVEPRTRNAAPADAAPLCQCAESSRIPERQRAGGMGELLRPERGQILRFGAKIPAERFLRRAVVRTERRTRRVDPFYGQPETGRYRHACGRRPHFGAAPGEPYPPPTNRRTTDRSRRSARLDPFFGRHRGCGGYHRRYRTGLVEIEDYPVLRMVCDVAFCGMLHRFLCEKGAYFCLL